MLFNKAHKCNHDKKRCQLISCLGKWHTLPIFFDNQNLTLTELLSSYSFPHLENFLKCKPQLLDPIGDVRLSPWTLAPHRAVKMRSQHLSRLLGLWFSSVLGNTSLAKILLSFQHLSLHQAKGLAHSRQALHFCVTYQAIDFFSLLWYFSHFVSVHVCIIIFRF